MSLFGNNVNNPGPKGGGLFDNGNGQKAPQTSLFGGHPLFGGAVQAPPPVLGQPTLFGGTQASGGGLFGTCQPPAPAAPSLFGISQPSTARLFEGSQPAGQSRPGGFFGGGNGKPTRPVPSLFESTQSSTGGLFGGFQPAPSLFRQSGTQGQLPSSVHSNQDATIDQFRQQLEEEKKRSAQLEQQLRF